MRRPPLGLLPRACGASAYRAQKTVQPRTRRRPWLSAARLRARIVRTIGSMWTMRSLRSLRPLRHLRPLRPMRPACLRTIADWSGHDFSRAARAAQSGDCGERRKASCRRCEPRAGRANRAARESAPANERRLPIQRFEHAERQTLGHEALRPTTDSHGSNASSTQNATPSVTKRPGQRPTPTDPALQAH